MNILIKLINDVKALCNTIITAVNAIKAKTDTIITAVNAIKAKTDTITANLFTSTHATRIDATISSRQADAGLTTTHASRIDASISSRASQASVDAIKVKTDLISAGYVKPSSTIRLNAEAEWGSTGTQLIYKFLMKLTGTISISFDVRTVSSSSTNFNISVRVSGIEIYASSVSAGTTYVTKTLNSVPVYSGVVEVSIHAGGIPFRSKSFKVMYDDDNLNTPTFI